MTILPEYVCIESKSTRETQLAQIEQERVIPFLNKVKTLNFALGKGKNTTVIKQIAQYFCPKVLLKLWLKWECFMGEKG